MTISFDPNLLISWYQAKASLAGLATAGQSNNATAGTAAQVPTAPWNSSSSKTPSDSALVTAALTGQPFINENAAKLDVPTANADYKKLFAINQGLSTLTALANAANNPTTPSFQLPAIQAAFARGMSEIQAYVNTSTFGEFRLTTGIATSTATSATPVADPSRQDTYQTAVLATGSSIDPVAAFQGAVQFDATVKKPSGATVTVNFDLSEMGATPRSMSSVAAYMNSKLSAAGVGLTVSVDHNTVAAQTITVNGQPVEVTPAQTQLSFQISGLSTETLTLSAPTTSPAVYVTQTAGDPNPDGDPATNDGTQQQELLKLETGGGADAARRPNDATFVAGQVLSEKLPDGVTNVHSTTTGADGSVYVVADGSGTVDGQGIKGSQDAVLLKYDTAGNLVYTQTLGAGVTASGVSVAVGADGKVAIAGSVTGELDAGDAGADSATSDSFVTLYDTKGQELWTDRTGALGADRASAVAFDGAGNVYVAGQAQGSIGGGTASGGWDGYLRAYNATGQVQSTRQFGSSADDSVGAIVVSGTNVYVAGQDGGAGMVRSFDITNPKQISLTASRSLGSLGGGSLEAIGLDGAGNLLIGGSTGQDLGIGTTTLARGGGLDGFGARLSTDLTSTASDAVAYFGGTGKDQTTAATISGGQVWLTGTTTTDLPGLAPVGKQDGYVAALDVGAGAVTYSQRFTAKDRMDAPTSIAVGATGASALDRLGLPSGAIQLGAAALNTNPFVVDNGPLVTTATSLRAGDQFQIKVGTSPASTITIAADDTMSSLADKIRSAGLFEVNVQTLTGTAGATLELTPDNDRTSFQLLPGPGGRDALTALGLKPGLIRNTIVDKTKGVMPADKGTQTYGLRFTTALDLNSKTDIAAALTAVGNATTTVRAIYADLKQAATPKPPSASSGSVPAYITNQIADYQAALDRLTGGGTDTSSGSSLVSLFG